MMRTRVAAVGGAALVLSIVPAQAASAHNGSRHEVVTRAVAVVERDGRTDSDSDFDLRRAGRRLSAATNTSVAYARCTDCRALAASFQVVLVRRLPADLVLTNRALAVTDRCTRCEALSYAYQWVVVTGTDRALSGYGRWRLARLDWRLRSLVRSRPPEPVLARGVERLAAQVQQVLATEVRERPVLRVRCSRTRR
jgi:hypothetical protein